MEIPSLTKKPNYSTYCLLTIFGLYISWILPGFSTLWQWIDTQIFYLLNHSFLTSTKMQLLWGIANLRIVDIASELIMLSIALIYVQSAKEKGTMRLRLSQIIYMIIWMILAQIVSKLLLAKFMKSIDLSGRLSPSLIFSDTIRISLTGFFHTFKDFSTQSFPGDHAITLLVWGSFLFHFCKGQQRLLTIAVIILFSLPRLVSGAHWPTDVLIGSISVTLLCMAIGLFTPLQAKCIRGIQSLFPKT